MTIRQLKNPCWVLRPSLDDERNPHYETKAEALGALSEARDDGEPAIKSDAVQLAERCWVAQCSGECEQVIDEEDECWVIHCDTCKAAEDLARSWNWVYSPDGRSVFCTGCAPENAEPVPPSPAELEAAGQLRLPGVAS